MKVEMLDVGGFTSPAGLWRKGDDLERRARFPVPAYLIESDEERVLVDTGLNPAAVGGPAGHYDSEALSVFEFAQEAALAERVDLSTITKVVLTHMHFDHAGGLGMLPAEAPVFVQRREWKAGKDAQTAAKNFLFASDYAGVEGQVVLLDGDHDLLGDGSIRLLSTPGHTPGHQSVLVEERLLIGGDVTHFASGLDDHRFPLFADDFAAQAASAERLRALRDAGVTYRPGHDPEVLVAGPVVS